MLAVWILLTFEKASLHVFIARKNYIGFPSQTIDGNPVA